MRGVGTGAPTPWVGLCERVNIGAFLLWVVVLAISLMRIPATTGVSRGARRTNPVAASALRKRLEVRGCTTPPDACIDLCPDVNCGNAAVCTPE